MTQPRSATNTGQVDPGGDTRDAVTRLRAWWEAQLRLQNPHSLFLIGAAALFLCTLAVDFLLNTHTLQFLVLNLALVLVCIWFGTTAFLLGRRLPQWVGLICVICFGLVSAFFVSPFGGDPSSVATMQELPVLALYLGWFTKPKHGRILISIILVSLIVGMSFNPSFGVDGALGVPSAVQAVVITVFCYETGAYLWGRALRRATSDPLTGVYNRAGFMKRIHRALQRSQRNATSLSLVVIDFDDFKLLNDRHGHAAGDSALKQAVELWRRGVRSHDVIGRTGGDEFALLFDEADRRMAEVVIGRLHKLSRHPWSWGIAEAEAGDTVETLFNRADEALYQRKRERAKP